ncbi:MAG: AraC family transcriptional regulator [Planctomycetes bacterium]|nr:AraC family transcriptional regulator [Planctomycetota bacterium]
MFVDWKRIRARAANCGRVRTEPGWAIGARWSANMKDHDLWFVWAGRGRMSVDGTAYELRPGFCLWARPGHAYEATHDPRRPLGVNYIHFDLLVASGGRERLRSFKEPLPPQVLDFPDTAYINAVTQRIVTRQREGGHDAQAVASRLLSGLLSDLDAHASRPHLAEGPTERMHREAILQIVGRIQEHPHDVPSVESLAQEAGYGPDHFARIFKKVMGQGPQAYVVRARIDRARQLLAESALTISQVAEALGYSDVFFFSRQFKQLAGQTPSAYRHQTTRG